jgi:hypothetical protein
MLLLVVMACATVFESIHGTERVLATFYGSWWFELLLCLLAANVSAAVILRYPFSKRQIGFVLTHAAILVTLAGALVTKRSGIEGHVRIAEGETVDRFNVREQTLTMVNARDGTESGIDLDAPAFKGFQAVDQPGVPVLSLGDVRAHVERYLPDSVWSRWVSDDSPHVRSAVEVSLSPSGQEDPAWVFAAQTAMVASTQVAFRMIADRDELSRLLGEESSATRPTSKGVVKINYEGALFEVPLEECLGEAVPLGDTGHSVRVLRYLPHAIVGADSRLTSASDRPVNPAIEVEIIGPSETETRFAFARFPDFRHKSHQIEAFDVVFVASADSTPSAPVEVLGGPDGDLHVRFAPEGMPVVSRALSIGAAVESPWPGWKFAVLRRFDHARVEWSLEPVDPVREERIPAVLVTVTSPEESRETWVQRHLPEQVVVGGTAYELIYGAKQVPLGFALTLEHFRVGYYPGTRRPRSFESQVTIVDPATARAQSRVISMNNPAKHGGYAFYQSNYDLRGESPVSVLSVSRDPGQLIVFVGYVGMMLGMVVVLGTRIAERWRAPKAKASVPEVAVG